jgi:site-specific recombinase XerD
MHKRSAWADDRMPDLPLDRLVKEFLLFAGQTVSPATKLKYQKSLQYFVESIVAAGEEPVLASVTPAAGERWVAEMQYRGCVPDTILGRQAAVKSFTSKFVFKARGLTEYDLLGRWSRVPVPDAPKARLTDVEIADVLGCFDQSPVGLRDRAFVSVYLSTGLRFDEVRRMTVADVDLVSGEFQVTAKGGKTRPVRMSTSALKACRTWLRWRRAPDDVTALWTTEEGRPLSYDGGMSVFRRVKKRSGVTRVHAHLLRHTYGQNAIEAGAEPSRVMDLLGQETDAMTRRYTREARAKMAAQLMPKYALA